MYSNRLLCISIFLLFRIAIANSLENKLIVENLSKTKNIVPLVIIGSGPAGLTAAMYGARAGVHTVVFTGEIAGGQLMFTSYVENWPGLKKQLGADIMRTLQEQAQEFGAELVDASIVELELTKWPFKLKTSLNEEITALSVIIATGAAPKKLGITGEDKYWARGVTACAVCDAPFFKDKEVIVVGGGDSAVEEALYLAHYASKVKILVRGNTMRAAYQMQSKLGDYPTIEILYNKEVLEILGDEENMNKVKIIDSKTGKTELLSVDGLFLAIGHCPNTQIFSGKIDLTATGHIMLKQGCQMTSCPGIFAAGDVEDAHFRQAVVAAGHGCKAALESINWLRQNGFTQTIAKKLSTNFYNLIPKK